MQKKFFVAVFFLVLAVSLGFLFLPAQTDSGPKIAPVNPAFLKAMEDIRAGKKYPGPESLGHIPGPVDLSYFVGAHSDRVRAGYAASYDLRTLGKITPVKDQGGCGSCWAFGAYGSLESSLLTGETRDFSELHLIQNHGYDWTECEGGNTFLSEGYLASWGGPYNETDYPYIYSNPRASSPAVQKHVQTIVWLPNRASSTDNDTIKYFLTNYGAVTFAFYYNSSYYNSATQSFYCPSDLGTNHEVCFVGWDDNYSKTNFASVPAGDGAFLCKNSWGTGWGNAGYFWISYYNANIEDMAAFLNAQPVTNYINIYQYDPLGWVYGFGYGTTTAWGANIFTASTSDPLEAIGFITTDKCTATYSIYKNPTAGNPTSGTLMTSGSAAPDYPGYYTVDLASPVSLATNDTFSVVVQYVNNSYTYPIPLDGILAGYSSGATSAAGQSFYSSAGTSWTDFMTSYPSYQFNCNIKAFTGTTGYARKVDFNADNQEDILWRYYGQGGSNVVWYLGNAQGSIPALEMFNSPLSARGAERIFMKDGASRINYKDARDAGTAQGREEVRSMRDPREATGDQARSNSVPLTLNDPRGMFPKDFEKDVFSTPFFVDPRQANSILRPQIASGILKTAGQAKTIIGSVGIGGVSDVNWQIVGTGDFDGDKDPDILWRYNGSGGYNVVWYMDGPTLTGSISLASVSDLNWQIVGTGDFDGDGDTDILWRFNGAGGAICVWYMNGVTLDGSVGLGGVSDLSWQIVGTGDFDADGDTDILWRFNGAGGAICVWYMNGVALVGTVGIGSVSDVNWQIVGTGDYDGDSKVDILWRFNGSGGYNVIWYMNGISLLGSVSLPAVSDLSWKIVNR